MMTDLLFDKQLAKDLAKVKQAIAAHKMALFQSGHGCACDSTGLCAHHAGIAGELSEATKAVDLAIVMANMRE